MNSPSSTPSAGGGCTAVGEGGLCGERAGLEGSTSWGGLGGDATGVGSMRSEAPAAGAGSVTGADGGVEMGETGSDVDSENTGGVAVTVTMIRSVSLIGMTPEVGASGTSTVAV
jgi:hypothetical protein